jgi:hypothetical protein
LAVASFGGAAQAEGSSTSFGIASSGGLTATATTSQLTIGFLEFPWRDLIDFTGPFEVLPLFPTPGVN